MYKLLLVRSVHALSAVWMIKDAKETLKLEKYHKIFENNKSGELFSEAFDDEAKKQKG